MNYTQKIEQVTESTWDFLSSQGPLCIFLLKLHKKAWIYQLSGYSLN